MNQKMLARVAAHYVAVATAQQKEIHTQWFYFNQSNTQPARVGIDLLEQHNNLESVISGLKLVMWFHGHDSASAATAKQLRKSREDFTCKLSDMVFDAVQADAESTSLLVAAREYVGGVKAPVVRTLSLLEDNQAA